MPGRGEDGAQAAVSHHMRQVFVGQLRIHGQHHPAGRQNAQGCGKGLRAGVDHQSHGLAPGQPARQKPLGQGLGLGMQLTIGQGLRPGFGEQDHRRLVPPSRHNGDDILQRAEHAEFPYWLSPELSIGHWAWSRTSQKQTMKSLARNHT